MTPSERWNRYQNWLCLAPAAGITLDISRMNFSEDFMNGMEPEIQRAFAAMDALEGGSEANEDEHRMVGHYWLRAPDKAPNSELRDAIQQTVQDIHAFAVKIHAEKKFTNVLCIGIGGSALGPMFVSDALGHPATDRMRVFFLDNTDPDGIERTLATLKGQLDQTLCIVTSKSGGTPETRNGKVMAAKAWAGAGHKFPEYAVAITKEGSDLDQQAKREKWLRTFPMWDWVGGRTSELSAVGLLPAALQGIDINAMLAGAQACDEITRGHDTRSNPAALLALMWHCATNGKGEKDMVVLPYSDRLLLFSRYLQQLVMESLGKEKDLAGNIVEQGIAVYGNKGSTDQHAYVQQLRDGVNNFFVTFIRVLESPNDPVVEEDSGATAGDYLHAFLLGTREALTEKGRESMTLTIDRVEPRTVGALIALFERAVGLYASLIRINAYHQPGVEAGKKAAADVLSLQSKVENALQNGAPPDAEAIARVIGVDNIEQVQLLLDHLRANGRVPVF